MIRRIRVTSAAVSLAAAVALAGCGGGDGDGDRAGDERQDSTTTTEAAGDATTTTAAPDTTAPAPGGAPTPGAPVPGDVGTQLDVDRTFSGEDSEAFCGEVRVLQESVSGSDLASIDEATVTGQMASLTPPAEIAADWSLVVSVQQSLVDPEADDPLAGLDQAQLDAYGQSSAVVAAYLGDVCQLSFMG